MKTLEHRLAVAPSVADLSSTTFSGRRFTRSQLEQVVETVRDCAGLSRYELAETLCEHLDWRNPRGANKTGCALRLLEALERFGLCTLPKRRDAATPSKVAIDRERAETEPGGRDSATPTSLNDVVPIELVEVDRAEDRAAFRASIEVHHYLGYTQPVGNHLGYFIVSARTGQRLGCLLYAASSAWRLPARDLWIGWDQKQRETSRHRVLTQQRFLLFPWVKIANLASHVLSLAEQRMAADWIRRFGYRPVLLETFVDSAFDGACYKAANWELVGQTQRRAQHHGAAKAIFVRPLTADFRRALTVDLSRRAQARTNRDAIASVTSGPRIDRAFVTRWKTVLNLLHDVAARYDVKWQKRQRVLNTTLLTLFVFRLITGKNRQGYGTTSDELWVNLCAIEEGRRKRQSPSPAAWCQGRKKLDEKAFKDLNSRIVETYTALGEAHHRWFGHRVFAVDGSKITLPPKLKDAGYPPGGGHSHYPQGLLSCLYALKSKLPVDFDLVAHGDERRCAKDHLAVLEPHDVVVYDRGYFSYAMLQDHKNADVHAVFRLQENSAAAVRDFMASGQNDTLVTLHPSKRTLAEIANARPDLTITPQRIRLVTYRINGVSYTLGTTLLDPAISLEALSDLYHARWGLEELYKISKRILCIEAFHSEYERGIKQELFAHLVLVTMNRLFANEADSALNSTPQDPQATPDPDDRAEGPRRQSNFKNCIHVVGRNLEALTLDSDRAEEASAATYAFVYRRHATLRPGRHYPRQSLRPETKWHPRATKRDALRRTVTSTVSSPSQTATPLSESPVAASPPAA